MKTWLDWLRPIATLLLATGLLCARPALADYVGELETTKYFDQTTINLITTRAAQGTGLLAGDQVSYFIQFTPTDNGGSIGAGGFVTDYIPAGTQVVNAQFVLLNSDGTYTQIAPPTPAAVYPAFVPMYSDTGIFYSTDARTAVYTNPASASIASGNGYALPNNNGCSGISLPSTSHNAWDNVMAATYAPASSANKTGTCSSPPATTYTGSNGAGLSPVAGPNTYLTVDSTGKTGPWQRIMYSGSMLGTATGTSVTGYSNNAAVSNACVGGALTSAGWNLSSSNPLPANTNAVRFAAGKVVVGELFTVRITLKLTSNMPASGIVNNSEVFGGDASLNIGNAAGHPSNWNQWEYFCPAVATSTSNLLVLKSLVGACTGIGCTPTTITAGVVPSAANLKLRYTVQYLNLSATTQTNVVLTDTLASAASYVAGSYSVLSGSIGTAAPTGTTVLTFPKVASLGSGASGKIQYDVNIATAPADGTALINIAKLVSDQLSTGVTSKAIATVSSQANLWIGKSTNTPSVAPGSSVSYTITIPNNGAGNAASIVVNDFLPSAGGSTAASRFAYVAGSAVVTVTNAAGAVTTVTPTSAVSSVPTTGPYAGLNREQLTITLPTATSIPMFGKLTITFNATVGANVPSSATPYLNDANVLYAGGPGGNSAGTSLSETIGTAPVTVTAPMSLSVSVACVYAGTTCVPYTNGTIAPGSKIRYQMNYKNISGATLSSVVLTNTLPANTSFVSGTGLQNGGTAFAPTVAGQLLTFPTITSLTAGSSGYVSFDVQLGAAIVSGTDITDTSNITASGFPAGVQASVTISVRDQANLVVVKTVYPSTIQVGGAVSYTITVTNTGNAVASGIQVYDELPFTGSVANATQRINFLTGTNTFSTTDSAANKLVAVTPTVSVPPTFTGYTLQTNRQELLWTFAPTQALAVGQSFTLTYTATAGANVPASVTPYTSDVQVQYISATNTQYASTVNTAPVMIGGLDHLALSFNTTGLSCVPQSVTVTACGNAACSTVYSGGIGGNVSASVGGNVQATVAFSIAAGTSSTTVSVPVTSAPSMTLGVDSLSVAPGGGVVCNAGASCDVAISACVGGANFNCQDSSIAGYSSATARLYTKLAGTPFTFDVLALNAAGAQESNFVASGSSARTVTVELFDASTVTSCAAYSSPLASQTLSFSAASGGRVTIAPITLSPVYPQLICRVTDSSAGSTVRGCSTDQFSLRPSAVTLLTTANAAAPSITASPAIKTGANFSVSATTSAGSGYAGTLTLDTSKLSAQITSQAVSVQNGGAVGSLTPTSLVANAAAANATYSEVGYLYLAPGAYRDDSFTAASGDSAGGDCITAAADPVNFTSDTLIGGKYGCSIGNKATVSLGRFIPDHFAVTPGTATPGCSAAFTYFGQDGFTTGFTLTAQNSAGGTTLNYAGVFAKLDPTSYSSYGFSAAPLPLGSSLSSSVITAPSGNWVSGVVTVSAKHQISRPTAATAETSITLSAAPSDGEVAASATATAVGNATPFRYGRLQLQNAYGSELLALPVPLQAQYWTGSFYATNTADSCTAIPMTSILMGNYKKNLVACNTKISPTGTVTLVAGKLPGAGLVLSAPGAGHSGSVDLDLNLSATASGNTCVSATQSAASAANMTWFGADPTARATFGIYKSPLIYRRENY